MPLLALTSSYQERLRTAVTWAWQALALKIGHGQLAVSREASLQLQFAALLHQVLPLFIHRASEVATVDLERGVKVSGQSYDMDVFVHGESAEEEPASVAIELKCYRVHAASGGKRGATDIFMKDVYEDLQVLERYCAPGIARAGVALVMNEHRHFVHPSRKDAKCWAYDISHGATVGEVTLTTSVGGFDVDITLHKQYAFAWEQIGSFWFAEVEGRAPANVSALPPVL